VTIRTHNDTTAIINTGIARNRAVEDYNIGAGGVNSAGAAGRIVIYCAVGNGQIVALKIYSTAGQISVVADQITVKNVEVSSTPDAAALTGKVCAVSGKGSIAED